MCVCVWEKRLDIWIYSSRHVYWKNTEADSTNVQVASVGKWRVLGRTEMSPSWCLFVSFCSFYFTRHLHCVLETGAICCLMIFPIPPASGNQPFVTSQSLLIRYCYVTPQPCVLADLRDDHFSFFSSKHIEQSIKFASRLTLMFTRELQSLSYKRLAYWNIGWKKYIKLTKYWAFI